MRKTQINAKWTTKHLSHIGIWENAFRNQLFVEKLQYRSRKTFWLLTEDCYFTSKNNLKFHECYSFQADHPGCYRGRYFRKNDACLSEQEWSLLKMSAKLSLLPKIQAMAFIMLWKVHWKQQWPKTRMKHKQKGQKIPEKYVANLEM